MTSDETYALEQEALAKELEGAPGLDIQAPKEPEVNVEVYRDVEPMLYRGFLTVFAEINGVDFVFKSLNQHEIDLLRFSYPDGRASSSFWNRFLAYGVFMIDGANVLLDRERWVPEIASTFSGFQPAIRSTMVRQLSEINRRASNAVALTECYAMEKYSRYRWYQLQGSDMTSVATTGIAGTERLGLNWAQLVWRALNHIEDLNDRQEQEWEHAKFVGSCMAGKGISKVYQQDADRRRKAKEEKFARKDKILRQVLFGEKTLEVQGMGGAILTAPRTVEELATQLQRDLRGEKDWHDMVVGQYEQKIRDAQANQRKQLESLAKTREEEFNGKSLLGHTDMRGLTLHEVQEYLRRKREVEVRQSQIAAVSEQKAKMQGIADRYFPNDPSESGR